jgi:hypothetical protein
METEEIAELARLVAEELGFHTECCTLTEEEQHSIKELLQTKKNAVRVFFYIFGALVLYAMKDIYSFVIGNLSFK